MFGMTIANEKVVIKSKRKISAEISLSSGFHKEREEINW
jgi:hypothetical protein